MEGDFTLKVLKNEHKKGSRYVTIAKNKSEKKIWDIFHAYAKRDLEVGVHLAKMENNLGEKSVSKYRLVVQAHAFGRMTIVTEGQDIVFFYLQVDMDKI